MGGGRRFPVGSALGLPAVGLVVDATGGYDAAVVVLGLLGLAAYAALLPLGPRPVRLEGSGKGSGRS